MSYVRIENWCVTTLGGVYTPPECQAHGLAGVAYGHPNFHDGTDVTTTEAVSLRMDGEDAIVTTRSGREYLLGQVDPNYERAYPGALARVIKSLGPTEASQ